MKFAFPRQRETHIYKKKLLNPHELNLTMSLVQLKKEEIRIEQENYDKL